MEDFPGSLPESKPNDNPGKRKKHRAKSIVGPLPHLASLENNQKNKLPKAEKTRIDDAFASLLIQREAPSKKAEKSAGDTKKGTEELEPTTDIEPIAEVKTTELGEIPIESESEEDEEAETVAEATDEKDKRYEPLLFNGPPPTALNGGEVIYLQDERPVEDRVIPLKAAAGAVEASEEAEPAVVPFEMPVFVRQPEQQHQGRIHENLPEPEQTPVDEPESAPVAGGGEVPPTLPPEAASAAPAEFPEPLPSYETLLPRPEDIYQQQTFANPGVAPVAPGEQFVTKKEMEDEVYYATKAGLRRGLITGAIVGGAYEHFKHKHREKKQAKRFKQQGKQLKKVEQNQMFTLQEYARQQAETGRQLTAAEQNLAAAQKRFENPMRPEKFASPTPEQLQRDVPEQLTIPADHRLETSAWHSIEIDAKTGKPVENPAFQYGHEYYRERAPESAPAHQRHAAAGEVALVAAATAASAGSTPGADSGTLPPVQIPNASMQGAPLTTAKQPANDSRPSSSKQDDTPSGPLWPWLLALAVIVIALIALLH